MEQLIEILTVWPFVLAVELSVGAIFIWVARDKPSKTSQSDQPPSH
jgi:hypothetical protein